MGSRSTNLKGKITAVTLVGHSEDLVFAQKERGLVVTMPDEKPCECAHALKITWR